MHADYIYIIKPVSKDSQVLNGSCMATEIMLSSFIHPPKTSLHNKEVW